MYLLGIPVKRKFNDLFNSLGVGKSSIILRFVHDTFNGKEQATIGCSYMAKLIYYKGHAISFQVRRADFMSPGITLTFLRFGIPPDRRDLTA